MSGDPWLTAYDLAQASAAEVLQLIQVTHGTASMSH